MKETIQWNSHEIKDLSVKGNEKEGFWISFNVRWRARTYSQDHYDLLAHQDWTIQVNQKRQFILAKHRAEVLEDE